MSETHNAVPIAVQPERKIIIYSTKTGSKNELLSNAKTWGELKPQIAKLGIDVDKMLITETVRKTDLVFDLAELPETTFYLIARPKETKSGAVVKKSEPYPLNRKELMAAIKVFTEADPVLKAKIGNISQTKTPDLEIFHKKFVLGKNPKVAKIVTPKGTVAKTATTKAPSKSTAKVKEVKTTKVKPSIAKAAKVVPKTTIKKVEKVVEAKVEEESSTPLVKEKELSISELASLAKGLGIR